MAVYHQQGHISSQRLNRDVAELFASDFDCTASHLTVLQTADSLADLGSISLEVRVFEGPYRGGRYSFFFHIPNNYPFHSVEVWSVQPIWHPNIDLRTGKVALSIDWSPVLTLKSTAIAIQMLMLEPSTESAMNLEALSLYVSNSAEFELQVQRSIEGGVIAGVYFPPAAMTYSELCAYGSQKLVRKRSRGDSGGESSPSCHMSPVPTTISSPHLYNSNSTHVSVYNNMPTAKRARRSRSDSMETEDVQFHTSQPFPRSNNVARGFSMLSLDTANVPNCK
jgi:ubiquitin-protein ligase